MPDIIRNGINGFCFDDIGQLKDSVNYLLENKQMARYIGQNGRETALKLFGKDVIKAQWKEFLGV